MEFPRKLAIVILTQFIHTIKLVSAHYCEPGTCEFGEYCCGDSVCCRYNDKIWNIMIAACVFFTLLCFCFTIFFMCRYAYRVLQLVLSNYRNLPRERESSTTNLAVPCDVEYDERLYSDPPPPYSEVVQIRK